MTMKSPRSARVGGEQLGRRRLVGECDAREVRLEPRRRNRVAGRGIGRWPTENRPHKQPAADYRGRGSRKSIAQVVQ